MKFFNVHERTILADPIVAGKLLDGLAGDDDRLWPHENWPAQLFDRPLGVGAVGGHGPIRYEVDAFEPGRLVNYRVRNETGFTGSHWFEVVPADDGVRLRHVVSGRAGLLGWLRWVLVIRWLHDALLEDALDKAERQLTGRPASTSWSAWVRLLRATFRRREIRKRDAR